MARRLAVAAVALAALAAPVAASGQAQSPPEALDEFSSSPIDADSIDVCWGGENADQADSWSFYMRKGTTAPPPGSAPTAEVPGGRTSICRRVDGLVEGDAYSFAVVGHNEAGDGPRQTLTAASRVPGAFVRGRFGSLRLRHSYEGAPVAIAVDRHSGRIHVAYQGTIPGAHRVGLFYRSRGPHGHWSRPELLTRRSMDYDHTIAADERGDVAVGWNSAPHGAEYRVRRAGSRHWSGIRAVPGATTPFIRLDALAFDDHRGLHAAVNHFRGQRSPGLHVLAKTRGRWHDTRLRGTACSAPFAAECRSVLSFDPVSDRLTVAARRTSHGTDAVLMADAPAGARRMGSVHTVATSPAAKLRLVLGSLTRRAGRITLALRVLPPYEPGTTRAMDDAPGAGLYLATGSSPAGMSRARQIPGTTVRDTPAVAVAAVGRWKTLLAWQRDTQERPSWNRFEQGVWVRRVVRDRHTGQLTFRRPTHRDRSPYAQLFDLAADDRGQPVLGTGD